MRINEAKINNGGVARHLAMKYRGGLAEMWRKCRSEIGSAYRSM